MTFIGKEKQYLSLMLTISEPRLFNAFEQSLDALDASKCIQMLLDALEASLDAFKAFRWLLKGEYS